MFLTLLAWMLSSWLVTVKGFDDVEFLPPHHLPFHSPTDSSRCWGHEHNCQINQSFSHNFTKCSDVGDRQTFFNEADFGYVGTKLKSLDHVCQPELPGDSELLCSSQMQFCTGSNIYLDLRDVPTDRLVQYDMDVLKYGQIGGRCKVKQEFIAANSNFMSALQSWAPGEIVVVAHHMYLFFQHPRYQKYYSYFCMGFFQKCEILRVLSLARIVTTSLKSLCS